MQIVAIELTAILSNRVYLLKVTNWIKNPSAGCSTPTPVHRQLRTVLKRNICPKSSAGKKSSQFPLRLWFFSVVGERTTTARREEQHPLLRAVQKTKMDQRRWCDDFLLSQWLLLLLSWKKWNLGVWDYLISIVFLLSRDRRNRMQSNVEKSFFTFSGLKWKGNSWVLNSENRCKTIA